MIANLRILGKFLDPQILPGERSGTFRDSVRHKIRVCQFMEATGSRLTWAVCSVTSWGPIEPGVVGQREGGGGGGCGGAWNETCCEF